MSTAAALALLFPIPAVAATPGTKAANQGGGATNWRSRRIVWTAGCAGTRGKNAAAAKDRYKVPVDYDPANPVSSPQLQVRYRVIADFDPVLPDARPTA